MTKMNEIKNMKDVDIATFVNEKREVVRTTNFGAAGKNTAAAKFARKDIARALTELNGRSANGESAKTE
jgi:ribosomal protein L29